MDFEFDLCFLISGLGEVACVDILLEFTSGVHRDLFS